MHNFHKLIHPLDIKELEESLDTKYIVEFFQIFDTIIQVNK